MMARYVLLVMVVRFCDGASFLFFHSPEPMSHARVLHTVTRYEKDLPHLNDCVQRLKFLQGINQARPYSDDGQI